jgi:hypothetical protein
MDPWSDLLQVVEHWSGTVGGAAVDEENRFNMRCWIWDGLQELSQAAGFPTDGMHVEASAGSCALEGNAEEPIASPIHVALDQP